MRGLRAALYKDLKLFLRGVGGAALILPFVLLLALRAGMEDLSRQVYVQPFSIGVQDLDNTLMSRSLISQMRQVQLFAEVDILGGDDSAQDALDAGAAAVVTIPKDFFYALYSMRECPVNVILNEDMPLESTLFRSIFCSVMDIIRANQSAQMGLYRFCYGDLTEELQSQLYAETSEFLFVDALGRQTVFDSAVEWNDTQGALERRLLACVLSVLALFFSLSAVKTLPEELALGVLPRFRSAGGSAAAFVLSKFLTAVLLTLPTLALVTLVFAREQAGPVLALALLLVAGAFGIFLALSFWTRNAVRTQRWGNLLLLLSLVLGGTLWPRNILPQPLPVLGKFTLPYYAALGLEAIERGLTAEQMMSFLWPVAAMGAAGVVLTIPALNRRRNLPQRTEPAGESVLPSACGAAGTTPLATRLLGLTLLKIRATAGGKAGLAVLLASSLLCGAIAFAGSHGTASSVKLAVADQDGTPLSEELCENLNASGGLTVLRCDSADQGRRLVLLGEAEGLLLIGDGYADALANGEQTPLSYEQAASATSAQGAREIVAGQVSVQRSRLRAEDQAEKFFGRALSDEESRELQERMLEAEDEIPALFHIVSSRGAAPASPFFPSPMGFSCLAVMFTLFTAAAWNGSGDNRRTEIRMASLPHGLTLSFGSDFLSLVALGLLLSLAVLGPGGELTPAGLTGALCYAFTAAALALAIARSTAQEGRVDALAPFLALILCLMGGCFLDFSQFSSPLAVLSVLTPPGLALAGASGNQAALAGLLAEGMLLLILAVPRKKRIFR